jgi:hypothetical protein
MLGKGYLTAALAGGLIALSLNTAEACVGSKALYDEKFAELDPGWSPLDDHASAAGGKLTIKAAPDQIWASHLINQANVFGDANYCGTVVFPTIKDFNNGELGLIFWGLDDDHYWMLVVSPIGQFSVQHKVASGRILVPVRWTSNPAIKQGAGVSYDLEIRVKGNTATVFVNGAQVGQVTGQPPDGGSLTGVYWSLPAEADASIEFTNLKVMN